MNRSPRCQAAIDYAKKACSRLGHSHITSAHLILGLITLNGGIGDTVLKRAGLSVESIEKYFSSRHIPGEETVEHDDAVFGCSATDALSRAEQEAAKFAHTILGVEHLALSLLAEAHGEAADLFASLQIECDKLRQTILQEMR